MIRISLILFAAFILFSPITAQERTPVVVEIFTSEGCNTCPPADKYLQKLAKEQPVDGVEIIALQEHVDYWNRHGWTDPFSSPQFSNRQRYYSVFFKLSEVFTPQMIVDGTRQLSGKTGSRPIAEAAKDAKGKINLTVEKESGGILSVSVKVSGLPKITAADKTVLLLAVTENDLVSKVSAGENKGSTFRHMAVTRYLKNIGEVTGDKMTLAADIPLGKAWKRNDLGLVAFVQEIGSRRIIAAAKIRLSI